MTKIESTRNSFSVNRSGSHLAVPLTISFFIHLTFVLLMIIFYLIGFNYKKEPFFVNVIDPAFLKGFDKPSQFIPPKGTSQGKVESSNKTEGVNRPDIAKMPSVKDSINTMPQSKPPAIGNAQEGEGRDGVITKPGINFRDGLPFANKKDLEKYAKVEEYTLRKESDPIKKNTEEFKYTAYFAKLKRRLESVGSYPELAKARRLQGEVRVNFSIFKNGKLGNLSLMSSSGHNILDEDAMRLLSDAAPYEAFPKEWEIEQLIIPLRVIYRINHIYVF